MLVVDRVKRSFGSVQAVRDVSFSCAPGSVFGFLGPNGAGKTTTMRMILGIFAPDEGTITWRGQPIEGRMRRRFGYLPEERGLYGKMKVRDQIAYFGRLHGLDEFDAKKRADGWLKTLRIEEYATRPAGELSKGNQQKVQLACAVLHDPDLLILDEPFSGLDPMNAEVILDCIALLASRGTTLVLSSHQMWQIEDACDAFCIIGAGRVRAAGTLAELRRLFPTRTVRVAPDLPEIRAVFAELDLEPHSGRDGTLAYAVPADTDFGALLRRAVAAGPVDTFERVEPSLNEIYVRALGETA
ncbi:MAG: ATP-binding cassette domain-containing protein [Candidatus Eremiobacteraeota bacterium]|nr:ATP-binding cassette domain-containing protein [Candidatus Eremiobacteraeota bacterium]MBC5811481.1 ATP-binding cassette domain-containing protein [Candidatus Eremiobacteraeota bacterium]